MASTETNYIGGAWVRASGDPFERFSPNNVGDTVGVYGESSPADVESAVAAAAAAFPTWSRLSSEARAGFLYKLHDEIGKRLDAFVAAIVRENGKTTPEAKGETLRAMAICRYYASDALMPSGDIIPSVNPNTHFYMERIPIGVAGLITPWNFPVAIPIWKAAPALLYGNTVVLKPSEMSPQTAHLLAEAVHAAGFPAGAFNLIQGRGETGKALVANAGVLLVSFTGSARTGKTIALTCAERGAKYQLEMGGKNPVIVLEDANLEQAANLVLQGAFKMAGQKCTATARVIVTDAAYDIFLPKLIEKAKALVVGDPSAEGTYLGPVINEPSRERILSTVQSAVASGCTLLCGGAAASGAGLDAGHYIQPTILGDVSPDSPVAQEEVFGPVLTVLRATDLGDALRIANGVGYGLSASCFTSNLASAMRFAREIEAGLVRINGETAGVEPQAPFGGMKGSSSFSREQGQASKEFWTQMKTIAWEAPAGS